MYYDIVQSLECEKKLNHSVLDVLENKVSELIAENGNLKVKNIQMIKDVKTLEDELAV